MTRKMPYFQRLLKAHIAVQTTMKGRVHNEGLPDKKCVVSSTMVDVMAKTSNNQGELLSISEEFGKTRSL